MTAPQSTRRLVVLGAGFVGWSIASAMCARRPVTVVGRTTPGDDLPGVHVVRGALSPEMLHDVIDVDCDVVYAIGSTVPGSVLSSAEMFERELRPLETALQAAADQRVRRFLYCSSGGTVYGDPGLAPVDEHAPLAPVSDYGRTRVAAEGLVAASLAGSDVDGCSLRLSNIFGPRQPMVGIQGVVGASLRAVLTGEPMPLYGEGRHVRDFLYIDDLVEAIEGLLTAAAPLPAAVNVGSGRGTTIAAVLDHISSMVGSRVPTTAFPARSLDVSHIVLAIDRLRSLVPDYTPRSVDVGLAECVRSLHAVDDVLPPSADPAPTDD